MFRRLICWLIGHRFDTVSQITSIQSCWGYRECSCCGVCEPWQHDMPVAYYNNSR
jgi:hypothetical protein